MSWAAGSQGVVGEAPVLLRKVCEQEECGQGSVIAKALGGRGAVPALLSAVESC